MKKRVITDRQIEAFQAYLREEERGESTIKKYLKEIGQFLLWLSGAEVTKEVVIQWKGRLLSEGRAPSTVNGKLTALDRFFGFLGWDECRVKRLKLQRRLFRDASKELNREEYERLLLASADSGNERLTLLMETICATGIRVSEVRYISVEAAREGRAEVLLKGKIRLILIPGKLSRKLLKYARKNKIASGEIFCTRSGRGMSRKQIWAEMKALCKKAGIRPSKVFPHNLRHLFARCFYRATKDLAKLADVLGHSSTETTRIYLVSTGAEHAEVLNKLRLVL